ncbi:MAG: tRNA epoxyqueuosine(34) reductase QueG [Candidatus Marinimicrobia bacterium]|jgi:epoxyqueuosine reductase|nr:tRNA epoxyqueuosine(34) reductase QueG [Candidatus Neomarinimicrobiota bacterium]|tara:strand:- start:2924 stop:3844 length:921 start_codon:yes stop_codon:yes gene_type:complete
MNKLSQRIKMKADELGFQKVGITKVEFSSENKLNLDQWISKGFHASMQWIENRKEERANIFNYFPDAVSLISVGMNYFSGNTQDDLKSKFKFSNYAWGEDYHSLIKDRLQILLKWIKNTSEEIEGVACVDTSPIMEKSWAQKAGLGWQGKHTNLISRDYGSWLFLGEIILNIPLDYDKPFIEDLCGSCTACIDACPTNAITSYQLDSNKCISYRTIEHRGEFDENENNLDGWIYGCDICQEVCPWNEKFSKISPEKSFFPKTEILDWSEKKWMDLDDATFKKLFKGSAVKRTKFSGLQRNIKQNSS